MVFMTFNSMATNQIKDKLKCLCAANRMIITDEDDNVIYKDS